MHRERTQIDRSDGCPDHGTERRIGIPVIDGPNGPGRIRGPRVRSGLARRLVEADPGLLVHFGTGIPEHELTGDVPAYWNAVGVEKGNTRIAGGIKQIVGLTKHGGK